MFEMMLTTSQLLCDLCELDHVACLYLLTESYSMKCPQTSDIHSLIWDCLQAMELVDAVGAPNIGVHLDTYHMNIEENNFENAIKICGDKLQ